MPCTGAAVTCAMLLFGAKTGRAGESSALHSTTEGQPYFAFRFLFMMVLKSALTDLL